MAEDQVIYDSPWPDQQPDPQLEWRRALQGASMSVGAWQGAESQDPAERLHSLIEAHQQHDMPVEHLEQNIQRHFPGVDPYQFSESYRQQQETTRQRQQKQETERRAAAARKPYENADETFSHWWWRSGIPITSSLVNFRDISERNAAQQRIQSGRGTDADFDLVAQHERLAKLDQDRDFLHTLGGTALTIPKMALEMFAGRMLGGIAGAGIGRVAPALAGNATAAYLGNTAAATAAMPDLWLHQMAESNVAQGRDPGDIKGLPVAFGLGMVNAAVLDLVQRFTPNVGGAGVGAFLKQTAARVGVGVLGQQLGDVVSEWAGQKTGYGLFGDLILRGDGNAFLKHAASQALVFATFGALHGIDPEPIKEKFKEAADDLAKSGVSKGTAGKILIDTPRAHLTEAQRATERDSVRAYLDTVHQMLDEVKQSSQQQTPQSQQAPGSPQQAPGSLQEAPQGAQPAQQPPAATAAAPGPPAPAEGATPPLPPAPPSRPGPLPPPRPGVPPAFPVESPKPSLLERMRAKSGVTPQIEPGATAGGEPVRPVRLAAEHLAGVLETLAGTKIQKFYESLKSGADMDAAFRDAGINERQQERLRRYGAGETLEEIASSQGLTRAAISKDVLKALRALGGDEAVEAFKHADAMDNMIDSIEKGKMIEPGQMGFTPEQAAVVKDKAALREKREVKVYEDYMDNLVTEIEKLKQEGATDAELEKAYRNAVEIAQEWDKNQKPAKLSEGPGLSNNAENEAPRNANPEPAVQGGSENAPPAAALQEAGSNGPGKQAGAGRPAPEGSAERGSAPGSIGGTASPEAARNLRSAYEGDEAAREHLGTSLSVDATDASKEAIAAEEGRMGPHEDGLELANLNHIREVHDQGEAAARGEDWAAAVERHGVAADAHDVMAKDERDLFDLLRRRLRIGRNYIGDASEGFVEQKFTPEERQELKDAIAEAKRLAEAHETARDAHAAAAKEHASNLGPQTHARATTPGEAVPAAGEREPTKNIGQMLNELLNPVSGVGEEGYLDLQKIKEAWDAVKGAVKGFFAPPYGAKGKYEGALREGLAKLQQKRDIATESLKAAENYFYRHIEAEKDPVVAKDRFAGFMDAVEGVTGISRLPQEMQPFATQMRELMDGRTQAIKDRDMVKNYIDSYFTHLWQRPGATGQDIAAMLRSRSPLEGQEGFKRQRTIPTYRDGLNAGLEPKSWNPATLASMALEQMDKAVMAHDFMKEMKDAGLARFFRLGEDRPDGWIKIDDVFAPPSDQAPGLRLTGAYYGPAEGVKLLNNHLSPGLYGKSKVYDAIRSFGNNMNMFQLGLSAFHGGMTMMQTMASSMALGVKRIAEGQFAKGLEDIAKAPARPFTDLFGENKILKEWAKPGSQGAETAAILDNLIKGGYRAHMDQFEKLGGLQSFERAVRDIRAGKNVPGAYGSALAQALPAFVQFASKPIMEMMVPRLKAMSAARLAEYEMQKNPNATLEQQRAAMAKVVDSIDNRFGQLAYDNLFMNRTLKDLAMVAIRSVGWNLGTVREIGGGIKDIGKLAMTGEVTHRLSYLAGMTMAAGFAGALYQYLATGKGPEEGKDYFFPKTGRVRKDGSPDRISLPSYMRDVASLTNRSDEGPFRIAQNLWQMGRGKMHPLLSTTAEILQNENFYGQAIYDPRDSTITKSLTLAQHLLAQFEPISIRGRPGEPFEWSRFGQGFFGLTPANQSQVHTYEQQRAIEEAQRSRGTPLSRLRRQRRMAGFYDQ